MFSFLILQRAIDLFAPGPWLVLVQGAQVILANLPVVLACAALLALGAWVSSAILTALGEKLDAWDAFSLGLSGAPLFLALLGFLAVLTRGLAVPLAALGFAVGSMISTRHIPIHIPSLRARAAILLPALGGTLLLLAYLLLKFGYIAGLAFPLYIDSVNHMDLIRQIITLDGYRGATYYHYGFHSAVIFITQLTGASLPGVMLVFGQMLQVLAPLSLYAPVKRITGSRAAAWISVLIAGLGWGMPSQVTSWGKYPALMALTALVFVFTVLYRFALTVFLLHPAGQSPGVLEHKKRTLLQAGLTALVAVTAIFVHSRMLILFGAGLLTLLLLRTGQRGLGRTGRWVLPGGGVLLLVLSAMLARGDFWSAWAPYAQSSLLFALLLGLLPFAFFCSPEFITGSLMLSGLVSLALVIPAPQWILQHKAETLMDAPFLSMFFSLPVSILFGVGLAGFEKFAAGRWQAAFPRDGLLALGAVLLLLFPNPNTLAPLPGVNYVSPGDLALYAAIRQRLPAHAKILVPNHPPLYALGIDGGAWIPYATGRQTVKYAYDVDFTSAAAHQEICRAGVRYIYAGSMPYSFPADTLEQENLWYGPGIAFAQVRLYPVLGCKE